MPQGRREHEHLAQVICCMAIANLRMCTTCHWCRMNDSLMHGTAAVVSTMHPLALTTGMDECAAMNDAHGAARCLSFTIQTRNRGSTGPDARRCWRQYWMGRRRKREAPCRGKRRREFTTSVQHVDEPVPGGGRPGGGGGCGDKGQHGETADESCGHLA